MVLTRTELVFFLISMYHPFEIMLTSTRYPDTIFYKVFGNEVVHGITNIMFFYFIFTITSRVIRSKDINNAVKVVYLALLYYFVKLTLVSLLWVYNVLMILICTNPPMYIDKVHFPEHKLLEDNFTDIRKDILSIVDKDNPSCISEVFNFTKYIDQREEGGDGCWRTRVLKFRTEKDAILEKYPVLSKMLESDNIVNATISMLDPNVSIPGHYGYFKGYLRYHLCIETPDNDPDRPFIVCGGKKYTWKTGEGVLFDDMFYHYVENKSKSRRIVLFLDVLRQDVSEPFKTMTRLMSGMIDDNYFLKEHIKSQHEPKPVK